MKIHGTGTRLARRGLNELNQRYVSTRSKARIGERYLDSVWRSSEDDDEATIAYAALHAARRAEQDSSRASAAEAALQVIARGVSGPVGAVLAAVGFQALEDIGDISYGVGSPEYDRRPSPAVRAHHRKIIQESQRDQVRVGIEFAESIIDYSNDHVQREAADIAIESAYEADLLQDQAKIVENFLRREASGTRF